MSAVPPKAEVNSEQYLLRKGPLRLDGIALDIIRVRKLEPRIMHYELSISPAVSPFCQLCRANESRHGPPG
jgi:hypothetical protein